MNPVNGDERRPPHLLVIGDLGGQAEYHVGDEAMLDANLCRFRRLIPDIRFTLVSRDPAFSRELYNADAIRPFGYADGAENDEVENLKRLEYTVQVADRIAKGDILSDTDLAVQLMSALQRTDGLLISGGGNLSSSWPQHIFERVALIHAAYRFGKPIAIAGQTIGPNLTTTHSELLAEALTKIRYLGVRELQSLRLALQLGTAPDIVDYQLDDAFDLPLEAMEPLPVPADWPFIAVTVHPFREPATEEESLRLFAQQLDRITEMIGAHLMFVPHIGEQDGNTELSDRRIGERLQSMMRNPSRMTVLDILPGRRVAWLTQQAAMVISTRYHPLVFGIAGGVAGLGIYVDDYTRIKLQGVLEHAELQRWTIPMQAALSDALSDAALELWERRAAIKSHIAKYRAFWLETIQQRETRLLDEFGLRSFSEGHRDMHTDSHAEKADQHEPTGSWRSIVDAFSAPRPA